jgi:hypothetical protein
MACQGSHSAMLVLLGTVAVVLLSSLGVESTTYPVGGNGQWTFPADNNRTQYELWSAGINFNIGDQIGELSSVSSLAVTIPSPSFHLGLPNRLLSPSEC